ncbi:MAG: hypothetical protein RIT81_22220 [Deltaproteobacteria bacterium]
MKRAAVILTLAAWAWGCDQDPPVESANMRRPSGLIAIDRTVSETSTRSDVLIVDSEAQGVRVLQYLHTDDGGLGKRFLPGPVVFFPLLIAAPGYPTRIAMNDDANRAFVIATVDVGLDLDTVREGRSYVHVLDVPELSTTARITPNDHILISSLDITEPEPGEVFVPVDIVSLGEVGTGTSAADRVAVGFDALGSGSGRVAIYDFLHSIAAGSAELALEPFDVYEVPGGVADLEVHDGRVYTTSIFDSATSALANVVTEVHPVLGAVRSLNAGGPTSGLVSAGPFGLLALRADIPSVVVFEGDPLNRATRVYPSPYTPLEERGRGGDELGRIDLRNSPLGPAAFAPNVPVLTVSSATTGADAPVVMVTHADGFASFLYAPAEDPSSPETFGLGVVSEPAPTGIYLAQGTASIDECVAETTLDVGDANPKCGPIVQVATPGPGRYRARFRGAMVRSRNGNWAPTSSTEPRGILSDYAGISYTDRQVRAGDLVKMTALDLSNCRGEDDEAPDEIEYDGVVTVVRDTSVEVELTDAAPGCTTGSFDVFFYEIFPSGDEGVLVQLSAGTIVDVIERVPSVGTATAGPIRMTFGGTRRPNGLLPPLAFDLLTEGRCTGDGPGDICSSLLECAEGWGCVAPSFNTSTEEQEQEETPEPMDGEHVPTRVAGLARCEPSVCPQAAGRCMTEAFDRGCPGLEVTVLGTLSAEADLKQDSGQLASSVPSAAPDDAVSFDAGRHFLVSYPGARSVVEVRTGSTLVFDQIR